MENKDWKFGPVLLPCQYPEWVLKAMMEQHLFSVPSADDAAPPPPLPADDTASLYPFPFPANVIASPYPPFSADDTAPPPRSSAALHSSAAGTEPVAGYRSTADFMAGTQCNE